MLRGGDVIPDSSEEYGDNSSPKYVCECCEKVEVSPFEHICQTCYLRECCGQTELSR